MTSVIEDLDSHRLAPAALTELLAETRAERWGIPSMSELIVKIYNILRVSHNLATAKVNGPHSHYCLLNEHRLPGI